MTRYKQRCGRNKPNYCIAAFLFCLFITLLSQVTSSSNGEEDFIKHLKEKLEKQDRRISFLELHKKHQDEEINLLRSENVENRNEIKLMKEKMKEMSINELPAPSTKEHQHHVEKHPARLLPFSRLRPETGDEVTIPYSCNDLSIIGHELNGIYFVKEKNNSKIRIVYCDFSPLAVQLRGSSSKVIENKLGFVDVNKAASGVYFYVQSAGKSSNIERGIIRFNEERLNIGGAMNLTSGVFKVPKAGIYYFSFSIGRNGYNLDLLTVNLRLNGYKIGMSVVGKGLFAAPTTFQSTLKLKKGDRVDLWKSTGGALDTFTDEPCHHFTGWMLEELE